ncbi:hypothetical protein Anapl_10881 [Anas platyrhynchos]|uniref:Uncharacterized protein n=1 Tax=Anas platyrhynchos TaxID=8839 RepID=R0JHP9_ANAPL|nr:hypothetical protein Anapl_10881 [Anas platyrhynchos]
MGKGGTQQAAAPRPAAAAGPIILGWSLITSKGQGEPCVLDMALEGPEHLCPGEPGSEGWRPDIAPFCKPALLPLAQPAQRQRLARIVVPKASKGTYSQQHTLMGIVPTSTSLAFQPHPLPVPPVQRSPSCPSSSGAPKSRVRLESEP